MKKRKINRLKKPSIPNVESPLRDKAYWENKYNALKKEMDKAVGELRVIDEIIALSDRGSDLNSLLKVILDSTLKLLDFDGGGIYLLEEDRKTAGLKYWKKLPDQMIKALKTINIRDKEIYRKVFVSGKPVISSDYEKINPELSRKYGIKSLASVPLFSKDKVIGSINIALKRRFDFTEYEINMLLTIGKETGLAIDKIKTEQALIQKTRYLELGNRIFEALNITTNLDEVADIILKHFDLYANHIVFIDKEGRMIMNTFGLSTKLPRKINDMFKKMMLGFGENAKLSSFFKSIDKPIITNFKSVMQNMGDAAGPGKNIMSFLSSFIKGEVLMVALLNSQKKKVGILILIKKNNERFDSDEIRLIVNLSRIISSSLEVYKMAFYDDLTGLPNNKVLKKEITERMRSKKTFALATLRISDFKKVIISRGEEIGDKCICEIHNRMVINYRDPEARVLTVRPSQSASFFFLIDTGNKTKIRKFTEKLISFFDEPFVIEGNSIDFSVNAGISFSERAEDVEAVIKNCNLALQEAIKKGMNKYEIYDLVMTKEINRQLELEKDLKKALKEKDFTVYYQPKTDTEGNVLGYEALVRWNRDGKIQLPGIFISKIEEMGLIDRLFEIVLETVCRDMKKWKKEKNEISINISPLQFSNKELASNIKKIISQFRIDPSRIKFEIIETGIMDENNLPAIKVLHNNGFKFSIDDFGAGYSKHLTLKDLSKQRIIDELKIDRALTKDINVYEESVIISSIIEMSEKLNIDVVAEGVEKTQQFMVLNVISKKLIIQGWLLSEALPPEKVFTLPDDHFKKKLSGLIEKFKTG